MHRYLLSSPPALILNKQIQYIGIGTEPLIPAISSKLAVSLFSLVWSNGSLSNTTCAQPRSVVKGVHRLLAFTMCMWKLVYVETYPVLQVDQVDTW